MAELNNDAVATVSNGVISLSGELDLASAGAVREVVEQVIAGGARTMVFDLGKLRFMDSSGIAVLVYAANQVDTVELRHPSEIIRRTIEITGLSDTFTIEQ